MATAIQPAQTLLTAEEFARRPDPGYPEELVKGRVETMPPPGTRHGWTIVEIAFVLRLYLQDHDVGRVVTDSGTVTERGPDSVRGPDVSFYSYAKLPKGPLPEGYPAVPPDLVVEVLSPHDRWPKVLAKVSEYLNAGVAVVCVLDPERRRLDLYEGDQPPRILGADDDLTLPAILGEFRVRVGRFLE